MKGFKSYTKGKQVKEVSTDQHDAQLQFAKNAEAERVDQYAKPGTSAAKRQDSAWETSFPTSRYRSRRP
ncbi:MAG: hypothetical protein R3260_03510 [Pseudomonas sp.]|nr:hypothetical protein [Pseudomonas sp.]